MHSRVNAAPGLSFNRDPHFQRVMPTRLAKLSAHPADASIGTLIFRG